MIHSIDPAACTGCGTCTKTCPLDVFRLEPAQEALSPCMAACPAGVDIRGNHYLIQQGHLGEAARRYRSVQPFPAITGRVCFHPCEKKCARNHVDEAVNINAVEQIMGDWDLKAPLEKPARRHITKVAVIGSGPAGVSAALYAVRAGVQTTVLTKGSGALARAEKIENYYGFAQPVSGQELERRSIENARRLGVQFVQTEAVGLTWTDRLTVETLAGAYPADAVILATGASRAVPRIPGLTGLEGHGVSWCAACDAFFYRGKDVAVLGSGEYALHEVQALLPVVKSVTLLTNGAALTADFPPEVSVCTQKVEAILGEQTVTGVQLAGGAVREVSGVFVALGVAGSTALARKLGAAVEGNRIVVDDKMQTTVPGLYAAGDCTGGLLQVAKAVYEGALAGTEAAKALRKG